ncbi:hypothetical protein [Bacillus sp. AFS088145]|uniref:hypothetical protein n=1 Tax=Bacillus sp. AFS088145 TaxID=2033514 RepID=UPI000BF4E848|nr:hypothetical protein [Bacillus sp. AFS088145]PFH91391.1 hypothetical protein COI44_01945 [Bacillus sp. AFS088145]
MNNESSNQHQVQEKPFNIKLFTKDQIFALTDEQIQQLKFSELIWTKKPPPEEFDVYLGAEI